MLNSNLFRGRNFLLAILVSLASALQTASALPNVLLWDSAAPLSDNDSARAGWTRVPSDLLLLEADPPKASSDPGYYGRDYQFKGDAVLENQHLLVDFSAKQGRVTLFSKTGKSPGPAAAVGGKKTIEIMPVTAGTEPPRISRIEIIRNAGDESILKATFSSGNASVSATFTLGRSEILEIKPDPELRQVRLFSPVDYGIVPGFIGDDLVFNTSAETDSAKALHVPIENIFLGLVRGEDREWIMTWPKGNQHMTLQPRTGQGDESIEFRPDGQSFYLAVLAAPGIWHKETLAPTFLEKDVPTAWKRPFPAVWKTQLYEGDVRTTFAFRAAKGQIWRGVPGSYEYPVWFDGENAVYHLSKKIPPKGESIVYFLEGRETPDTILTPVDILKSTLGRPMAESILDTAGRKLRTHHRRGGESVHRACTCGFTEAIQAVFEARQEVDKRDFINLAVDDMIYFVDRHVERINEYRRFADELLKYFHAQSAAAPELKPYFDGLEEIARRIPEEYEVQKENMKNSDYCSLLATQTRALTGAHDSKNLNAYMDLLKAWRGMGGSQDYVVAQCHNIARKLFQESGYSAVTDEKAATVAREIRARCRQVLRNPDGYEIWADY